jgi:hypothetical protein
MYRLDEETKSIIDSAKALMVRGAKNVEYLLKEIGNKNNTIAKVIGANVFAVGSEILVLQILENLSKSFLFISTIGLRTLLENYINVHYIYHHPDHLNNEEWAETQCKDYIDRTIDPRAQKSRLGDKSLYKRAKIIQFEELYTYVYSDLCNYSHFLADSLNSTAIPFYFKGKTVETAIYTIMFYQDILIAISSFYGTSFDVSIDDIFIFKKKGQDILSNINVKEGYREYEEMIKNLNRY